MTDGGSEPCDVLQVETELDLIEGELAVELPGHMRAFAHAHAAGRPPPAAPTLLTLASTLATAQNALAHDLLVDRGVALLRLCVPVRIESDRVVSAARAEAPSWAGLQRLAVARDAVAHRMFGMRAVELVHRLHGAYASAAPRDVPPPGDPVVGWSTRDVAVETTSINDVWQLVAARLGASGHVRFDRAARGVTASPRTFVIEPRREVIVVLPHAVDTPATRFAVLHELGHAYLALTLPGGVPRVVDEAAAAYLGRLSEPPSWLPAKWLSPLAEAARHRRLAIARTLDVLERRLPELGDLPGAAPPWALWYDPGSQASYVAAEAIVDRIVAELGPNPPRGQVLRALTAERDRIDDRIQL